MADDDRWTTVGSSRAGVPNCLDGQWLIKRTHPEPLPWTVTDLENGFTVKDHGQAIRWGRLHEARDWLAATAGIGPALQVCERHDTSGPWCGPCMREAADAPLSIPDLCLRLDEASNRATAAVLR